MKIVDGNKAASKIAYLFSEVCAIYPITPSSPMAENVEELTSTDLNNLFNVKPKIVELESEAGAAGALHGSLLSGSLSTTFTASQGLLLMIPNMYKIAGEGLPGVIHCAARSLSTHALSIFGDHQDIYATRATGFCMLASTNVEDAQNLAAVAHLSAIKGSLPFIHFFDGFRTSHELNTINELDESYLLSLIDQDALKAYKEKALNLNSKAIYGTSQTEDIYFQCTEARNKKYNEMPDIVNEYMDKINKATGKDYKPFNYYGNPNAKYVIVAMGSVCDTIKKVIDNEKNKEYGLIEVHLYRPFSKEYLLNALPSSAQKIAVLDRTKEAGSTGEPLYLDIVSSLKGKSIDIVGGRYGLSSKDTTPSQIKAVYNMLENNLKENFTIGITDDVTNLSLKEDPYSVTLPCKEIKIYGFGSDGMVSASKELLTLTNKHLKYYVQGYFEYDSKKSGGVTVSHLRLSNLPINAPFYVQNPEMVVITKDSYFKKFDMLSNIKDDGYVLVNTIKNEKEFNEFLPSEVKKVIKNKNLKINLINAEKIAYEHNLKGKINKIMEVNILNLLGIKDAKEILTSSIKEFFKLKGEDVINNNIESLNDALGQIKEITIDESTQTIMPSIDKNIYEIMEERKGNSLKVSDVMDIANGKFPCSTSGSKTPSSGLTASWDMEKCIECGKCALVCPHAVIKNIVTKDKSIGKPLLGNEEYNFMVAISNNNCTGCGLCVNNCPTKSLELKENVIPTDKLFNEKNPELFNKFTIKGAALKDSKIEFPGACAGCGETPYIKLLTELYGDEIVIANATGCSSIYGASAPCMPYKLSWANSLFEDNAEFAYGMHISYMQKKNQINNAINKSIEVLDEENKQIFKDYLEKDDFDSSNNLYNQIDKMQNIPNEIISLKEYIPKRTVWAIGGDGWAYDIGYNGIDHILHSGENIKILVLDTEVYSNTGGQASKASKKGAIGKFAGTGKKTYKKDLFKIASAIDNVYVASIALGANMMQAINAFKEAMEHDGPAVIIAYCPCIEHGIKKSMSYSIDEEKLAVECGYHLLMRYKDDKLLLDYPNPDFEKYKDYLEGEVRYASLKIKNPEEADKLIEDQKNHAIKRFNYYKDLVSKNDSN